MSLSYGRWAKGVLAPIANGGAQGPFRFRPPRTITTTGAPDPGWRGCQETKSRFWSLGGG